jgi:hypothetical protein
MRNTGRSNPLEDVIVQPAPIERFSGIGFTLRRDFLMPNDSTKGQSRVSLHQTHGDVCKRTVLSGFIRDRIRPFDFYSDRKIVAARATSMTGLSRVPRATIERDEL